MLFFPFSFLCHDEPALPFKEAHEETDFDASDIFLPSYANIDSATLEQKQDPVQDIIVTDEEMANMFPS